MEPRRSALIIATDEYGDPKLRRLRAPVRDAEELARVLADETIGGFEVDVLLNEEEYKVRRSLAQFFANRNRDDLLLVHFSCHGLKDDDGNLYFATPDTELEHLDSTSVPSEFVNRQMRKSRSRRIALFLDCCYSGAFSRGAHARAGDGVELAERFDGQGQVVITASNAMEYAFEGEELTGAGTPSVFTTSLVEGLESGSADRDGDNLVSVDELYDYVFDRVRAKTPDQTPSKWTYDLQGELYIAKNPRPRPVSPAELPHDLRSALESPLAGVRIGAVTELERVLLGTNARLASAARLALAALIDDDSRSVSDAAGAVLAQQGTEERAEAPVAEPSQPEPRIEPVPVRPEPLPAAPARSREGGRIRRLLGAADPEATVPRWWRSTWPSPRRAATRAALVGAMLLLGRFFLDWSGNVPQRLSVVLYAFGLPLAIAAAALLVARARAVAPIGSGALAALGLATVLGSRTLGSDSKWDAVSAVGTLAVVVAAVIAVRLAAARSDSEPTRHGSAAPLLAGLGAALWASALFVPWASVYDWTWWVPPASYNGGTVTLAGAGGPQGTLGIALVGIGVAVVGAVLLRAGTRYGLALSGALGATGVLTLLFFGALAAGAIGVEGNDIKLGLGLGLGAGVAILAGAYAAYRAESRQHAVHTAPERAHVLTS